MKFLRLQNLMPILFGVGMLALLAYLFVYDAAYTDAMRQQERWHNEGMARVREESRLELERRERLEDGWKLAGP